MTRPPFPSRRDFITATTVAALGSALTTSIPSSPAALPAGPSSADKAVKAFYDSLSDAQKKEICFDWDYRVDIKYGRKPLHVPDPNGVLLRTHISNAWLITPHLIGSPFYTDDQCAMILRSSGRF